MIADERQRRQQRQKRMVLLTGYGLIWLFLLLRVVDLQIARHDALVSVADQNRLRPRIEQPTRGRIYDRKYRILVDNRPSWTVTVMPVARGAEQDSVLTRLAGILQVDTDDIRRRLLDRRGHLYAPVPIRRDVPFDMVARIKEQGVDLPGVGIQMEPRRLYPYGIMASHVLGYLREIDDADLTARQRRGEEYLFGDLVGRDGLERAYEATLRGRKGISYIEVDAVGRTMREADDRPGRQPVHGASLVTTLDAELHQVAEAAFHDTMRGAVVAMDPRDGALLVLASLPDYDPLAFSGVLDQATVDRLFRSESKPMLNRSVAGLYPPASTYKIVTALAGLQQGIITATTTFDPCGPGGWRYGVRRFQCWRDDHGRLTVVQALEQSCDIYFYQLGLKLGLKSLHELSSAMGIGELSGSNLPGEQPGLFPSAEWYNRRLGAGRWIEGSQVINLSIGQGEILSSPLQIAVMTAAVANGGQRVIPYLVRERLAGEGALPEPITTAPPLPVTGLDQSALDIVRQGMIAVVHGQEGTARHLAPRLPGILIAGKTGTAQNPHGESHALFSCFAPADAPEIVVTVVVENGGGGSAVAAPIAVEVLRRFFQGRLPGGRLAPAVEAGGGR